MGLMGRVGKCFRMGWGMLAVVVFFVLGWGCWEREKHRESDYRKPNVII